MDVGSEARIRGPDKSRATALGEDHFPRGDSGDDSIWKPSETDRPTPPRVCIQGPCGVIECPQPYIGYWPPRPALLSQPAR